MQPELRNHLIVCHASRMRRAVESFLLDGQEPHLIHSFGVSGCVGAQVSRRLKTKGIEAIPVVSASSTNDHESRVRARAVRSGYGILRRIRYRLEHVWTKLVVDAYEQRSYTGSRLILVNYESVRRLLEEKYALGHMVRKLPYTSESAFLRREKSASAEAPGPIASLEPADAPLVLAVSRHDPRKGIDILLRALSQLRTAGVRFRACLIGAGPLRTTHKQLAERLGLGGTTVITGFVDDPWAYRSHADVYVLPSLEEGSGSLSLIEALQAGLPSVVSDLDGLPEDVTDGYNALLVNPGDPIGLAEAIARILSNEPLREMLARCARETFVKRFSAEAFTEALRDTYAQLGFIP